MASVAQNFTLGAAGLVDLVGRESGLYTTHYAADVYADQVASDPTNVSVSDAPNLASLGATPEEVAGLAHDAAVAATDAGALEEAARQTGEQLEEGLSFWGQVGLGVLVSVVAGVILAKIT